jgi:hypothetical protein
MNVMRLFGCPILLTIFAFLAPAFALAAILGNLRRFDPSFNIVTP